MPQYQPANMWCANRSGFVWLYGPTWTGKSRLCLAVRNDLIANLTSVSFETMGELATSLMSPDGKELSGRLVHVDALILDNIESRYAPNDFPLVEVMLAISDILAQRLAGSKATILSAWEHPIAVFPELELLRDPEHTAIVKLDQTRFWELESST